MFFGVFCRIHKKKKDSLGTRVELAIQRTYIENQDML